MGSSGMMQRFNTHRFRGAFRSIHAKTGTFSSRAFGSSPTPTEMIPGGKKGPMLQRPSVAYGKHQMDKVDFSKSLLTMLHEGGFTKEQLEKVDHVVMNKMGVDN